MHASIKKSTADLTHDTVVGIFPDERTANKLSGALVRQGFGRGNIHIWPDVAGGLVGGTGGEEHGGGIMDLLRALIGPDTSDEEMGHYAEAVRRGRFVVAVVVDRANRDRVADIMIDHDAIDIDREVASYRAADYTGYNPEAGPNTTPEATPAMDREPATPGGVRVYTHLARKP